jgi:hypothetical protein
MLFHAALRSSDRSRKPKNEPSAQEKERGVENQAGDAKQEQDILEFLKPLGDMGLIPGIGPFQKRRE